MNPQFAHIDHWIFDLDNVLYPSRCNLFALIDERMGLFLQDFLDCDPVEARRVQKDYFHDHGTTLAGLMHHHGTDPHVFLDFVHDIAMDRLEPAPMLRAAIEALPGERMVFTNADTPYAEKVLERRGLSGVFEIIHDIHACALEPKPEPAAYHSLISATGIDPAKSLFVEDMARNLTPAKALGMTTVWVNCGAEWGARDIVPEALDHIIPELEGWLVSITATEESLS